MDLIYGNNDNDDKNYDDGVDIDTQKGRGLKDPTLLTFF